MSTQKAFLDRETSFRGRYSKQSFEALYYSYREVVGRMVFFIAAGFIGRLLLLSNANIIGVWVDSFCQAPAICQPVPEWSTQFTSEDFIWLLLIVTSVGFVFTGMFRVGFSRSSAAAVSRLYDEVTLRTSRFPLQFFDTNPVGRVVTRFSSDYGGVFRLFGGPLAEFLAIIFDLTAMLILITWASPYYLPIVFAIGLANFAVYRLNRDKLRHERRELSANRSPAIAHFAETTQGASTIRIFGRQGIFLRQFASLNDRFLDQRLQTQKVVLKFSMQMSSLTALLLLGTGVVGYYLSRQGLLSIGSIGVAFTFIVLSGTSMQMFFEWMAQFEEAMTGVERLDDYLRRPLEGGAKLPSSRAFPTDHPFYKPNEEAEAKARKLVATSSAPVSIKELWFRYSKELPWVLKGLDFEIRAGEKIGIIGRTGSGKTSLIQALFHLYPIDRGQILIGGIAPKSWEIQQASSDALSAEAKAQSVSEMPKADLSVYRRAIGLISQEPTLFRGSVRENLDLVGDHGDEELIQALERVGLGEWLGSHSAGLDTAIEERGRNLSAGEKQLLCMARCLLLDAPVVVMDEATSSVDPQSEEILVRATKEFFADRTQIIIAHRLSTLDDCDRVLWLHKGEVRMFDTPEKVIPVFKTTQLT